MVYGPTTVARGVETGEATPTILVILSSPVFAVQIFPLASIAMADGELSDPIGPKVEPFAKPMMLPEVSELVTHATPDPSMAMLPGAVNPFAVKGWAVTG